MISNRLLCGTVLTDMDLLAGVEVAEITVMRPQRGEECLAFSICDCMSVVAVCTAAEEMCSAHF